MKHEESRERTVRLITNLLMICPFTFEVKVVKKPKHIRVIYELTQKEMKTLTDRWLELRKLKTKEP